MTRRSVILLVLILINTTGITVIAAGRKMMSIQVKTGEVRSTPSFLGKILARLSYGDRVDMMAEKGAWMMVGLPGEVRQGWIHGSALTRKKIVLNPGAADVQAAAASDEIALAGKGFNEQVEGEFKAKNPNIDYAAIDKMETMVVSREQMLEFLKEGDLSPQGGDQ